MVSINKRIKASSGFTLIELMVATSILMAVMFSGYYGYSLYAQKWQKRTNEFWSGTKDGIALTSIVRLFESSAKYVVKDKNAQDAVFFIADQKQITFVSHSPLYSDGAAVVQLQIVGDNEQKQLIYREMSLKKAPLYHYQEQAFSWQKQVVLLNDVDEVNWHFFGFNSYLDAVDSTNRAERIVQVAKSRYNEHDLSKIRVLPDYVFFHFTLNGLVSEFRMSMPAHSVATLISNKRQDA